MSLGSVIWGYPDTFFFAFISAGYPLYPQAPTWLNKPNALFCNQQEKTYYYSCVCDWWWNLWKIRINCLGRMNRFFFLCKKYNYGNDRFSTIFSNNFYDISSNNLFFLLRLIDILSVFFFSDYTIWTVGFPLRRDGLTTTKNIYINLSFKLVVIISHLLQSNPILLELTSDFQFTYLKN